MSANGFDSAGTVACGKQWSVTALLVVPNDSENLATWQPLPNHFPLCPKFKCKIARLVCPRPLRPRAMSKPLKKTIRVSYSMGMIYNIDDIYI